MRNLQQAVQELYILASPQSPMRDLLAGITRQLTLTQPPPPPPGVAGAVQGAAQSAGTAASQAAGSGAATLQGLFEQVNGPPPEPPGQGDRRSLRRADRVRRQGPPGAPIDNALKLLNDLQVQLARLAGAPAGGAAAAGGGDDPAQNLQAEASQDPQPVRRWLEAMAISGNQLRGMRRARHRRRRTSAHRAARPCCASKAVAGRYPFTAGSTKDIPLDDFARLFATGGSAGQVLQREPAELRRYFGRDMEGAAGGRRRAAGHARAIWRSSSARRRSATCSSPAAAISRPCGSTSCRRTPTPRGDARPGWPEHRLCTWAGACHVGDLAGTEPHEQRAAGV